MGNEVSRPAAGGDLSPQSSGAVPTRSPYTPTGSSSGRAQSFNARSPSPSPAAAFPSALPRRTSSSAGLGSNPTANPKKERTIQRMDKAIRRRVRGGITYNMKLLLRGAKGTGKTSLFQRLKGEPIPETNQSTPQLQSATINWSFRQHLEENVRCEVWDVVDRGFLPVEAEEGAAEGSASSQSAAAGASAPPVEHGGLQNRGSLSAEASAAAVAAAAAMQNGTHSVAVVDASTVDVYHEAHGVIFLLDVTKWDTLEYVKQQLDNVPVHIPTLVLGNFRDQGAQRQIFKEDIQELLYGSSDRPQHQQWRRPIELLYFECSLLNCYGLKSLHQYFGIPFLQLKLATIRQQMRIVEAEFAHLKHDVQATISEQRYADYVEHIKATGSDIRTGRRGSGNGTTPPASTRNSSLRLPRRSDTDQAGGANHVAKDGGTDEDVSVVSKDNGGGTPAKLASPVASTSPMADEASQQEQGMAPSQDMEDLPARSSSAVIQSAAPLMFEHKESMASVTDAVENSAANVEDKPAPKGRIHATPAVNTNSSRPRKASVEEVIHLEDFQVPKTRTSDLEHFYSEDESDEDGGEYDEDVVVAPVDGAMKTTISGVYHKQRFLDSDSSDSDESEIVGTQSRRKGKASRKSQTATKKTSAIPPAKPKLSPSSPSPHPPSSPSRPKQGSRPGSPARSQPSSPAKEPQTMSRDVGPKQDQYANLPAGLTGVVTPTPPAAPPTSALASSIRHSSPRNKSDNSGAVVHPETGVSQSQTEREEKYESSSGEEPELTGTEDVVETVSPSDQETTKYPSDEDIAASTTTIADSESTEPNAIEATEVIAALATPIQEIYRDASSSANYNGNSDPEDVLGAPASEQETILVQKESDRDLVADNEEVLDGGVTASSNESNNFLANNEEEDTPGDEAVPQVTATPSSPHRPDVLASRGDSDNADGPTKISLSPLQASLPIPEPEPSTPLSTPVVSAPMVMQSSTSQQDLMGHYHKRNIDEAGDLLSLSALQASLPLPGKDAAPLSSTTSQRVEIPPAYSNGGNNPTESAALHLSDLQTTPSSASPYKSVIPEFSTVVPSNDLEAFLNESDSDSENAPSDDGPTLEKTGVLSAKQSRRAIVESSDDDDEDEEDVDRFASYNFSKKGRSERRRQQKEDLRQLNAALDGADNDPFAPAAVTDSSFGSSDVMEAIRKAQEEAIRMLPPASLPAVDDDADSSSSKRQHKHKHKKEHKHKKREGDDAKEKLSKKSSRKSGSSSRSKKRRPHVQDDIE